MWNRIETEATAGSCLLSCGLRFGRRLTGDAGAAGGGGGGGALVAEVSISKYSKGALYAFCWKYSLNVLWMRKAQAPPWSGLEGPWIHGGEKRPGVIISGWPRRACSATFGLCQAKFTQLWK